MYKVFSVKRILCFSLLLMMAISFAACKVPTDDKMVALTNHPIEENTNTDTVDDNREKIGEFEAIDFDGNTYTAADIYSGNKLTMINLWSTTCGPCIKEMPFIEQLSNELADQGFKVYGIQQDSESKGMLDEGKSIVADRTTYPHLRNTADINSAFFTRFNVIGLPTTFFLDSEGHILEVDGKMAVTGGNDYDSWKNIITGLLGSL